MARHGAGTQKRRERLMPRCHGNKPRKPVQCVFIVLKGSSGGIFFLSERKTMSSELVNCPKPFGSTRGVVRLFGGIGP